MTFSQPWPCFRRFAGIETMQGRIPDETTILNFRHLLEEHRIAEQILEGVNQMLSKRGVMLREGTPTVRKVVTSVRTVNQGATDDHETDL
ncbi:MAG: transposase [Synechococcaceae cyanobacterium]